MGHGSPPGCPRRVPACTRKRPGEGGSGQMSLKGHGSSQASGGQEASVWGWNPHTGARARLSPGAAQASLKEENSSNFLSFLDLGRGSGECGIQHQAPPGLKPSPATSCFTLWSSVFSPAKWGNSRSH